MQQPTEPIAVTFPLVGEWCAVNTPGHKIPSHGTNQLGQKYAYDFIQIDWSKEKGFKYYKTSTLRGLFFGIELKDIYCWSQPIYAPFDGVVAEVKDGCIERNPVHWIRDLAIVIKNSLFFDAKTNEELFTILGNYIILKKCENIYALMAHAKRGSIIVSQGEKVIEGQVLAEVGHSGNSTAPHLHFQLMDKAQLLEAKGLPCCFKSYELYKLEKWESVTLGIPGKRERIRA